MNKQEYLEELERLLKLNNIPNKYSILKDYESKINEIDKLKDSDDVLEEIESPKEVLATLVINNNDENNEDAVIDDMIIDERNDDLAENDTKDSDFIEADVTKKDNDDKVTSKDENKSSQNEIKAKTPQFRQSIFEDNFSKKDPGYKQPSNKFLYFGVVVLALIYIFGFSNSALNIGCHNSFGSLTSIFNTNYIIIALLLYIIFKKK